MADLRMPDVNHVMLSGRLTRDPETRVTESGLALCQFTVAHSKVTLGEGGEKKETVSFWTVETWRQSAERLGRELTKGRPVIVEGRLTQRAKAEKGQHSTRIIAVRVHVLDWPE